MCAQALMGKVSGHMLLAGTVGRNDGLQIFWHRESPCTTGEATFIAEGRSILLDPLGICYQPYSQAKPVLLHTPQCTSTAGDMMHPTPGGKC